MSFTIADIRNKLRIFASQLVKRNDFQFIMLRVGILGGGQLGRMLLQEAANYPVQVHVMEKDENCPAANLSHNFINGDITAYQDVINFGKFVDVLSIQLVAPLTSHGMDLSDALIGALDCSLVEPENPYCHSPYCHNPIELNYAFNTEYL